LADAHVNVETNRQRPRRHRGAVRTIDLGGEVGDIEVDVDAVLRRLRLRNRDEGPRGLSPTSCTWPSEASSGNARSRTAAQKRARVNGSARSNVMEARLGVTASLQG
jgi:hypothetical protein